MSRRRTYSGGRNGSGYYVQCIYGSKSRYSSSNLANGHILYSDDGMKNFKIGAKLPSFDHSYPFTDVYSVLDIVPGDNYEYIYCIGLFPSSSTSNNIGPFYTVHVYKIDTNKYDIFSSQVTVVEDNHVSMEYSSSSYTGYMDLSARSFRIGNIIYIFAYNSRTNYNYVYTYDTSLDTLNYVDYSEGNIIKICERNEYLLTFEITGTSVFMRKYYNGKYIGGRYPFTGDSNESINSVTVCNDMVFITYDYGGSTVTDRGVYIKSGFNNFISTGYWDKEVTYSSYTLNGDDTNYISIPNNLSYQDGYVETPVIISPGYIYKVNESDLTLSLYGTTDLKSLPSNFSVTVETEDDFIIDSRTLVNKSSCLASSIGLIGLDGYDSMNSVSNSVLSFSSWNIMKMK